MSETATKQSGATLPHIGDSSDPAFAIARFSAAEARLYPLALADTEAFERATSLVSLVAVELQGCAEVAEILEQLEGIVSHLPESAAAAGIDITNLPLPVVADAAAAIRCRELKAEQSAADLRERIQRARAEGQTWLVDEASPALAMSGIQRRQERHLPTGATLVTTAEADDLDGSAVYTLELFPGSPANGVIAVSQTYTDRTEWLVATERVRARLSA